MSDFKIKTIGLDGSVQYDKSHDTIASGKYCLDGAVHLIVEITATLKTPSDYDDLIEFLKITKYGSMDIEGKAWDIKPKLNN